MTSQNELESRSCTDPGDLPEGRILPAGTIIKPHFLITELLGKGSSAVVYRGWHQWLGVPVSIKVIHDDVLQSDEGKSRFFREAKILTKLQHPALAKLFYYGRDPEVGHFIVMEYVEGVSLCHVLKSGALEVRRAAGLVAELCDAMDFVHENGIVHRDIKPGNIVLTKDEQAIEHARIIDFGIARAVSSNPSSTESVGPKHLACPGESAGKLTSTGVLLGSPAYMSPEQCKGTTIDTRTDIYSVGCVLFESACGRVPFTADGALSVMQMHLNDDVHFMDAPSLPPDLKQIICKAMQKDPQDRFHSMAEMRDALRNINFDEECIQDRPPELAKRFLQAICALLLICGVGIGMWQGWQVTHLGRDRTLFSELHASSNSGAAMRKLRNRAELATMPVSKRAQYYVEWLGKFERDFSLEQSLPVALAYFFLGVDQRSLSKVDATRSFVNSRRLARLVARHEAGRVSFDSQKFFDAVKIVVDNSDCLEDYYSGRQDLTSLAALIAQKAKDYPGELATLYERHGAMSLNVHDLQAAKESLAKAYSLICDRRIDRQDVVRILLRQSCCQWQLGDEKGCRRLLKEVSDNLSSLGNEKADCFFRIEMSGLLIDLGEYRDALTELNKITQVQRELPFETLTDVASLKAAALRGVKQYSLAYEVTLAALKRLKPSHFRFVGLACSLIMTEELGDLDRGNDVQALLNGYCKEALTHRRDDLKYGLNVIDVDLWRASYAFGRRELKVVRRALFDLKDFFEHCSPEVLRVCGRVDEVILLLEQSGDSATAQQLLKTVDERLLSSFGNNIGMQAVVSIHLSLIDSMCNLKLYRSAFEQLEQLQSLIGNLDPDGDIYRVRTLLRRGVLLRQFERYTESLQCFKNAREICSRGNISCVDQVKLMVNESSTLSRANDFSGAVATLELARDQCVDPIARTLLPEVLHHLARTHREGGQLKEALSVYQQYCDLAVIMSGINTGVRIQTLKEYATLCDQLHDGVRAKKLEEQVEMLEKCLNRPQNFTLGRYQI